MMRLEDFKEARRVLKGILRDTSLVHSPYFSRTSGNNVYFKPENMQVTGAYKIRGAYYTISTLTDVVFGTLWYRIMALPAPLDEQLIEELLLLITRPATQAGPVAQAGADANA